MLSEVLKTAMEMQFGRDGRNRSLTIFQSFASEMVVSNIIQLLAIGEIHRGILRQIVSDGIAIMDDALRGTIRHSTNLRQFIVEIRHYHIGESAHIFFQSVYL